MHIKTLQKEIDEKRIINDQTFNIWKKRKDMKDIKMKLITYI